MTDIQWFFSFCSQGTKSEHLPDLLASLFDPSTEVGDSSTKTRLPASVLGEKLAIKYEETMKEIQISGEISDNGEKD